MTATTLTLIIFGSLSAGAIIGFLAAASLATARRADNYDPMEYTPEQRVMPRIWDGFNGKENT